MHATEHRIETDEYFFNPGWFSSREVTLFELKLTIDNIKVPNAFDKDTIVGGFFIDIDPTFVSHQRSIYNFLDFMGDIGGLYEALNPVGAAFMYFFGTRGLQGLIVSSIFFVETADEKTQLKSLFQKGN